MSVPRSCLPFRLRTAPQLAALLFAAACGTTPGADTADSGAVPVDTADTGDTADTAADTADTGADTGDTGDTADTADTQDTAPKIDPLLLKITNSLSEPVSYLDVLDSGAGTHLVLVDAGDPILPGKTAEFKMDPGTWSIYAETPTGQCGSVENVVMGDEVPGFEWTIASLIDCTG